MLWIIWGKDDSRKWMWNFVVCVLPRMLELWAAVNGQNECDLMVPGEQLRDTAPVATGDDLRGPGWLWAHAAGEGPEATSTTYIVILIDAFSEIKLFPLELCPCLLSSSTLPHGCGAVADWMGDTSMCFCDKDRVGLGPVSVWMLVGFILMYPTWPVVWKS